MTPYRDGAVRSSAITSAAQRVRDIALISLLTIAAAVFAIAAALGWIQDGFLAWMGAGLSACSAVGVLVATLRGGTGDAPCPMCGAALRGLERVGKHRGIHCEKCDAFLQSEDGALRPMAPDTIADEPIFSVEARSHFQFPPGCVVCGAPATQDLPVSAHQTIGIASTSITVYVPHCAAHDDGAAVVCGVATGTAILFRSYAYRQAFKELNEGRAIVAPSLRLDG